MDWLEERACFARHESAPEDDPRSAWDPAHISEHGRGGVDYLVFVDGDASVVLWRVDIWEAASARFSWPPRRSPPPPWSRRAAKRDGSERNRIVPDQSLIVAAPRDLARRWWC
jgi:hypothetical protein